MGNHTSFKSKVYSVLQRIKSTPSHIVFRQIREIAAPINTEGIDAKVVSEGVGGHHSATEFKDGERPEVFTPSTVILKNGYGIWELPVPRHIRKNLIDMTLRIETIHTHGMLHTPPYKLEVDGKKFRRRAEIFVNGRLVDQISLVRPHPHGEDYGVDSRRPFPVLRYIDKDKNIQTIKVSVDKDVLWDIDRVTLEPILLRKEIRPEAAMIIGALISAMIGAGVSFFLL